LRTPWPIAVAAFAFLAALCACESEEPETEPTTTQTVEPVLEFSTMYLPSAYVLTRERTGDCAEAMDALSGLDVELTDHGVAPAGPPFIHYLGKGDDGCTRYQVGVCVSSEVSPWGDLSTQNLPERLVAYLETSGPWSDTRAWEHGELAAWAEKAGFEITGTACDYFLNWGTEGLPESLMAEVTLPITVPEEPEE
jgi:effector-binding domain-containing protein